MMMMMCVGVWECGLQQEEGEEKFSGWNIHNIVLVNNKQPKENERQHYNLTQLQNCIGVWEHKFIVQK
jgi:hypothetical protein